MGGIRNTIGEKFDHERLFEVFPAIRNTPDELREKFFEHGKTIKLEQSQTVWTEGDVCTNLALILRGSVRVYKISETGRENHPLSYQSWRKLHSNGFMPDVRSKLPRFCKN